MTTKKTIDELAEEILRDFDAGDTPAARAQSALQQARDAGDGSLRQDHLRAAQAHIAEIDPRANAKLVQQLQAEVLALQGRGGDTRIAHVTPNEVVLPRWAQTPELMRALAAVARSRGIDPATLRVGSGKNRINPRTGQMEFDDQPPPAPSQDDMEAITVTAPRVPQLTDDDVNLLGRMIFTEGAQDWRNPDVLQGLGSTALNRYGNPDYQGMSFSDIVHQPHQFQGVDMATTPSGKPSLWSLSEHPEQLTGSNASAYAEAQRVARGLVDGTLNDNTGGATLFGNADAKGNLPSPMQSDLKNGYERSRPDMGIWTFLRKSRPQ